MLLALCAAAALSPWTMTGAVPQEEEPAVEHKARAPLPSMEEIAALPTDGGEEFNRLIFSSSPYLLQHARNPVDWHEWGPAAFELAAERGVPVFLSIGYSTCHWCHVMEHESFEDVEVARLMNEAFVCVKLDREERPDIDQLYMTVTQALTGSGGWPMTVVMTPDKRPFFAGTYFPKQSIGQRFGMLELVPALSAAWTDRREEAALAAVTVPPSRRKAGRIFCMASRVAPCRIYSSASTMMSPLRVDTVKGVISSANLPDFCAASALFWLATANSSCASRPICHWAATFSAVWPMW